MIQQLCVHVAYAFCPAFAVARRRWLISCQLLRPEPRLIDRSRRKLCIPYSAMYEGVVNERLNLELSHQSKLFS